MTETAASKTDLRRAMRSARRDFVRGLEVEELDAAFTTLPRRLWPLFAQSRMIGLYHAFGDEAPTRALIDFCMDARREVALPRLSDDVLRFHRWSPGDPLEPGPHGLEQPSGTSPVVKPDLLFVPLIAFDGALNRLGQGGGHYDRWLCAHAAARAIGLGWSVQEVDALPTEPHDRPLAAMLTERSVIVRAEHAS